MNVTPNYLTLWTRHLFIDAIEKTRELEKHLEEEAKRQKSREDAERINKVE